ncbi:MAG: formate/nitrite transporter family protein [Clostridia bacterium]|nr:formate/nitrite transporter family protein [Clostridia bacterium]
MSGLKTFIYGIIGGMCISIGGCAFLASESKVVGAVFFVVGLFTICTFGFNLFTGKVCYSLENNAKYLGTLGLIWLGNFAGCLIMGGLLRLTRLTALVEKAQGVADTKLGDSLLSIFILAIFCNILIYIAVDGFKNNPHEIGKYLALFFGVTVFVLCGFEHCVANMFYITAAGKWSGYALLFIIVNTLGNAAGGLLIPVLKKISDGRPASSGDGHDKKSETITVNRDNAGFDVEAAEPVRAFPEPAGPEIVIDPFAEPVLFPEDYKGLSLEGAPTGREAATDALLMKIAADRGVAVPEEQIEAETDMQVIGRFQSMKYAAMGNGGMFELMNLDKDALREEAREDVIKELTIDKVLKAIIKAEDIQVTPEELEREAERIVREQNTNMEMVKRFFGDDLSGLAGDVRIKKARDLVYETAVRKE